MEDQQVYNITIGALNQPGKLTVLNGKVDIQMADGSYLIKDGVLQGLPGTKIFYAARTSGGTVNAALTFVNGLLITEG